MIKVRVTCPACTRAQSLPGEAVMLVRYGDVVTYSFTCPSCGTYTVKPAGDDEIRLLRTGGITARLVVPAPRPTIEGRDPAGPPINEDDLIALGRELYAP